MEMPSHRETAYDRPSATAKLQALLSDLRRKVQLLSSDIVAEEQLTRIFALSDPRYSILARNQRTRRDNLLATIALIFDRKQLIRGMGSPLGQHEMQAA